jgi:hypothetical protein
VAARFVPSATHAVSESAGREAATEKCRVRSFFEPDRGLVIETSRSITQNAGEAA